MKDYTFENVNLEDVDYILNFAADAGLHFDTYEGVLNDVHIIEAERKIKLGRVKPREYIVCYYEFASMWGNTLHILMTDNADTMRSFIPVDAEAV